MTVLGTKRDTGKPVDGVDQLLPASALDELLPRSDFVVLAVPNTPETVRLMNAERFRLMRPTAFLINIARGSVVNEADLIDALDSGVVAGALLDVFEKEPLPEDSPLWRMHNVIVTPHVAGSPSGYEGRVFDIFAENIERFVAGRPLHNEVALDRGY